MSKTISNKSTKHLIGLLLIVGVVATAAALYIYNNSSYPKFTYDSNRVEGWWGSKNINIQDVAGDDYQGDEPREKLPVADLTVHHGTPGSVAPEDNCFVMYSYFNYLLDDMEVAYKDYEDKKVSQGTLEKLEPLTETIATFEGSKEYHLKRYNFTEESQGALSGYQVGFVPLSVGYIRIEGVCKTPIDLALTLPAMQAVQLLGS